MKYTITRDKDSTSSKVKTIASYLDLGKTIDVLESDRPTNITDSNKIKEG